MKSNTKSVNNTNGFSVIEVLVAIGLMGIVSLGIAEMFRQMSEQQRNVVQVMNKQDLKSIATIAIRDKKGCANTLLGLRISTNQASAVAVPSIKEASGTVMVPVGFNVGEAAGTRLTVTGIRLFSTTVNIPFTKKGAIVRIAYSRVRANGTSNESLDIPISVIPDVAGNVSMCYGYDSSDDSVCEINGGTFNQMTGVCDYTQLCINGTCVTTFDTQKCPKPGEPATYRSVVGIKNGQVMCGPMDNRAW